MRAFQWLTIIALLGIAAANCKPVHADEYSDTIEVFAKSASVKPFFKSAYGYAVFPTVGKGGFVVGGAYGTGQVYAKGKVTGTAKLVKMTIGLQAGGQAFREMIFFEDKRAYEEFAIPGRWSMVGRFSCLLPGAG
jgi:lipid-binding SYLF domain-containing protein